ncbi:subtilisin-like serine protease [Flammeovirgaceae bacterium 311]|nr:subtilisin-like serine protease [Flammeovirgaceae bacterium 311]
MKINYKSGAVYGLMLGLTVSFSCSDNLELDAENPTSPAIMSAANLNDGSASQLIKLKYNSYIVISTGTLPADLKQQIKSLNGEVTATMDEVGIATVTSTDPNFAAKAGKIKGVSSVIRDLEVQWYDPTTHKVIEADEDTYGNPPFSGDDDQRFDLQWGHDAIDAPEAWNAGARGKGVRIAVLDSGFDLDHPDLAPNIDMAASKNFVTGEVLQYALPDVGSHGTHTAGTIAAADNGIGIIGVAPEAQLILVKVLRDSGSGSFGWMMQGILHATAQGADVINMSLGAAVPRNGKFLDDNGTPDDPSDDFIVSDTKAVQELITAINKVTSYAKQQGVTLIASAGNDANNGQRDKSLVHIPSSSPSVISISATAPIGWILDPFNTNLDNLASYSNYGTSDVDFAAPGGDYLLAFEDRGFEIISIAGIRQYAYAFDYVYSAGNGTNPAGNYYWSVGTSMAGPHAAGVAALIVGQNGGDMDPAKVEAVMRASADDLGKPGRDPLYGHGRVNAYKAVTAVQ